MGKNAALPLKSNKKMMRQDGMLTLIYAAEVIGYDKYNSLEVQISDDTMWDGFKWEYPEFLNWEKINKITLDNDEFSDKFNYAIDALFFSIRRISGYNNKPLLEYNKKTLRAETALTRRDAIMSIIRLYDSKGICSYEKMVQINKVSTYNKNIL